MIEDLVNHYISSCQEIPLRFPSEESVSETEEEDDGDIRTDKHLGDERPHFTRFNEDENLNEQPPNADDDDEIKNGDKHEGMRRQERKRRNEEGNGEKMGMKKKSSSSSSPATASGSLQDSRQSVSSSSESINVISVDDDEEEEQIEDEKIKMVKEESEERKEKEDKVVMNYARDGKKSRCLETNGGENHSSLQHHVVHRMDDVEIDLLNSSNSSSSSSSSSWSTINSNSKINLEMNRNPKQSKTKILELLFTSIQQLASFCKKVDCFNILTPIDQETLLKGCILEMCFIRSGVCFDQTTNSWPDPNESIKSLLSFASNPSENLMRNTETKPSVKSNHDLFKSCQGTSSLNQSPFNYSQVPKGKRNTEKKKSVKSLSISDIRPLMSHELFTKYTKFIKSIQEMNLDQISVIILCIIILLSPDRIGLVPSSIEFITRQQEKYLLLLQRYMAWKFGHTHSSALFPKLLLKLPDLRELSELLNDYQLVLCKEEVQSVQNKLQQQLIISPPKDDGFQEE